MGRKQREFDRIFRLLESQINQQRQASPWETAMTNEYNTIDSFLKSKDYRNLPSGVTIDLMSQADNNKMRQMMMGRDTSGQVGKGGPMSQIANTQKMLLNDQAAKEWSGAFEQKIGDLNNRKLGMGQALQGMYSDRMGAGTAGLSNLLGMSQQRPSGGFWQDMFRSLIPQAAGAALSFI